jgi:hypothetical protein
MVVSIRTAAASRTLADRHPEFPGSHGQLSAADDGSRRAG